MEEEPDLTTNNDLSASPTPPHLLESNVLYVLKYWGRCNTIPDTKKLVDDLYPKDDIDTAYAQCCDLIPEEITKRKTRSLTKEKKIDVMITWITTNTNIPSLYPDNPFKLPPPDLRDLSLVRNHNLASQAMDLAKSLESKLDPSGDLFCSINSIQETLKSVQSQFQNAMKIIGEQLQHINNSVSHNQQRPSSPPQPARPQTPALALRGGSTPGEAPATTTPTRTPTSPPLPPPPLISSSDIEDEEYHTPSGWETGHSHSDRRRIRRKRMNDNRRSKTPPGNREDGNNLPKRCHLVVHNLYNNITEEDISRVITDITGSPPLILTKLPCKIRDRISFRVTCPLHHLPLLTCENFGSNVKISRYHLSRDFPVGRLRQPHGQGGPATLPSNPPEVPPTRGTSGNISDSTLTRSDTS